MDFRQLPPFLGFGTGSELHSALLAGDDDVTDDAAVDALPEDELGCSREKLPCREELCELQRDLAEVSRGSRSQ